MCPDHSDIRMYADLVDLNRGFLGLLHMEIVQERLEREYDLNLITTAPTVIYQIETTAGEVIEIHNPADLPAVNKINEIREPIIQANKIGRAHVLTPVTWPSIVCRHLLDKKK